MRVPGWGGMASLVGMSLAVGILTGCASRQAGPAQTPSNRPLAAASSPGTSSATATQTPGMRLMFNPANATALAHDAILPASALPGTGWNVASTDTFDNSSGSNGPDLSAVPACKPFASEFGAFGSGTNDVNLAGRAETTFTMAEQSVAFAPEIDVEVDIYRSNGDVSAPWTLLQRVIDSAQFNDCMAGLGQQALAGAPAGFSGSFYTSNPGVQTPRAGIVLGMQGSFSYVGVSFDMTADVFVWSYGNALITTTVAGTPSAISPAFMQEVLVAVDQHVVSTGGK